MPGRSVVLIEPNAVDLNLFMTALAQAQPAVTVVNYQTAMSAINALSGEPVPELIFADLYLPDMQFVQFAASVRALTEYSRVRLIAFVIDHNTERKAILSGASYCLTKPVTADKLNSIFANSRSESAP